MDLFNFLFGCRHKNMAFPITRRVQGRALPMYVVCLDCGKETPYDWHSMRPVQTSGEQRRRIKQQKIEARLESSN